MLQSIEGIYKDGTIKLLKTPKNITESQVIVTFLETQPTTKLEQIMYFGMFSGLEQSTEEDFQVAEFHGDIEDNLD